MFHFLILLLIFGVVIVFAVLFGVFGFVRMLFRGPRGRQPQQHYNSKNPFEQSDESSTYSKKGKVISDQEGEYVDYEEIK
jgi:hypothetical protein